MFAAEHRAPRRAMPLEDKEKEADGFPEIGGSKRSGAGRETVAGEEGIGRGTIVMEVRAADRSLWLRRRVGFPFLSPLLF